jgi:two-component system phosphate regulon sensor histidine kinase PhoR
MKTLFLKIFSGTILIVTAFAVLILLFTFGTLRRHDLTSQTDHLESLGLALSLRILPDVESGDLSRLNNQVRDWGVAVKARITVVDDEGRVLADSDENPSRMESHRFRPEIVQALNGRTGVSIRFSNTVKKDMLYVGLPLRKEGRIVGALRVSRFLVDIDRLLADIKRDIAAAAGVLLLLVLAAAFLISRSLSKPVRELIALSQKVAAGDFSSKVYPRGKDELSRLAESFHAMTANLKSLFAELGRQKEELNRIISSIREGLLVLDSNGRIELSNDSLRRIVQNENVEGKYYWETVRSSDFLDLMSRVKTERRDQKAEIRFNEKTYLCSATYMEGSAATVVLFHDLTEWKKVEQMKMDFVANASHELRTPLTAVKGGLETLEAELGEKAPAVLGLVRRNTERLMRIVEDLLLLSGLEGKEMPIKKESVDLNDLVRNVIKIFKKEAAAKGLRLDVQSEEGLPRVSADPFLLEQVFINLIENAVRFTEKGGVEVRLKARDNGLAVEVEDTGIGISAEQLPHIFERFYVIDPSRSRKKGGTGLGLSIVKHILLLHGWDIRAESEPGRGTTFFLKLPLDR